MSESLKHKIFNSSDCLSERTMFDYIGNKLNSKEQHAVEKHLLECELCSDAMEGLKITKDKEAIGRINKKINERITSETKKEAPVIQLNYKVIMSIAAAIALLVGAVFFFKQYTANEQNKSNVAELRQEKTLNEPLQINESKPTQTKDSVITEKKRPTKEKVEPPAPQKEDVVQVVSDRELEDKGEGAERINNNINSSEQNTKDEATKPTAAGAALNSYSLSTPPAPKTNEESKEMENEKKKTSSRSARNLEKQKSDQTIAQPEIAIQNDDATTIPSDNTSESIYTVVEQMPEFPGGQEALTKYIHDNFKYPKDINETDLTKNTIYVAFVVNEGGRINNATISKGINKELNKEALRLVNNMPNWKPGKQKGKTVSVKYTLPIKLELK